MYLPTEVWDKALDGWLGLAEDHIDLIKRNPFFLEWMGISLQQHLAAKRWIDLILERMWRQMGLPPLGEVTRLHERVTLLESKLREEDLPRTMKSLPGGPEITRIRRYA